MKKFLSIASLFVLVGCQNDVGRKSKGFELQQIFSDARMTYYKLGRNAGVNAALEMQLRQIKSGHPLNLQEIYAYADSVAGVYPDNGN